MMIKKSYPAWINFSGMIDKINLLLRKEKRMDLHPKVLEMIDKVGLTPLHGLIVNLLTDPDVEYSHKDIAVKCMEVLGKGSRRSVGRIARDFSAHIEEIHLAREMELRGNEFTTTDFSTENNVTVTADPDNKGKGGNGQDLEAEGIVDMGDGGWDVTEQLDCVTACSKVDDKAVVFISAIARKKLNLFMKWAGAQEWLAYLKGKWVKDNHVEIIDLVLPSQNANATLVHNVNVDQYVDIVGVMHSHHEMGGAGHDKAGFSGHDEAFINSNHNVSLLVAKDGIAGHIRVKTPCGAFIRIIAKVKNMDEVEVDEKKLKEEFKSKINFGRGRGSNSRGSNRYFDHPVADSKNYFDGKGYHFR